MAGSSSRPGCKPSSDKTKGGLRGGASIPPKNSGGRRWGPRLVPGMWPALSGRGPRAAASDAQVPEIARGRAAQRASLGKLDWQGQRRAAVAVGLKPPACGAGHLSELCPSWATRSRTRPDCGVATTWVEIRCPAWARRSPRVPCVAPASRDGYGTSRAGSSWLLRFRGPRQAAQAGG